MTQYTFSTEATGTVWNVTVWTDCEEQDVHDVWASCLLFLQTFESRYSRFRLDSFLSQLSHREGEITVPDEFVEMLLYYQQIYHATDGLFTPLVGALLSDLGYDDTYSFLHKAIRGVVPNFLENVEIVDADRIEITKGLHFDLGALGKGYAMDRVSSLWQGGCAHRILLNAGGDIIHWSRSQEKARVGLENPEDPSQALGVIEIGNVALASSATGKRRWRSDDVTYHHIADPSTYESARSIDASWVLSECAVIADGLATSLFLASPEALGAVGVFDYAVLSDSRIAHSQGFDGAFFTT